MKPPSNVKTPEQYVASLPPDRAKTIETVRALVNKHIPHGYDECLVWGTIGWTIPLSRTKAGQAHAAKQGTPWVRKVAAKGVELEGWR